MISRDELMRIAQRIYTRARTHGSKDDYKTVLRYVAIEYPKFVDENCNTYGILDPTTAGDFLSETFIKQVLNSGRFNPPNWNPAIHKRNGKSVNDETFEDIRNLDLWEPDPLFYTDANVFKRNKREYKRHIAEKTAMYSRPVERDLESRVREVVQYRPANGLSSCDYIANRTGADWEV